MKQIVRLSIALVMGLNACQQEKVSEVEKVRQALESRRQELNERKEIAKLSEELQSLDAELRTLNGIKDRKAANGRITASDVVMRAAPSVQADKKGNFNEKETVTILQKQVSLSNNEAIANQNIQLGDGSVLSKGKAVKIVAYHENNDSYDIEFQHPNNGAMTSNLPSYIFDKTDNDIWYLVRRSNGETGWVFGRFLKEV